MADLVLLSAGNSIHTIKWANSLYEAGVDVCLVTSHQVKPELNPNITVYSLPFSSHTRVLSGMLAYLLNVLPLFVLLLKIRPKLVHAHYASGYGMLAALACWICPFVVSVWGSDVYIFPKQSKFKECVIRFVLARADKVCSTSHDMAKETEQYLPRSAAKPSVIPFGVDVQRFSRKTNETRNANADEEICIGTVKGLKAVYGIDYLIQAFEKLVQKGSQGSYEWAELLRLKIWGSGELEQTLKQQASATSVADIIEFKGYAPNDDVPNALSEIDIFVAYSRSESFGVSVIEASLMETPVVVSDVGGLPEVVKHGETGLVVPANAPDLLAEALLELVNNRSKRFSFGTAAKQFATETYSQQRATSLMVEFYQQNYQLALDSRV